MKVIIAGSLEFKTARSFQKALKMYLHRTEVLYKNQLFFQAEDIFMEDGLTVTIPRFVKEPIELRWWKNTMNVLEYIAAFATSGTMSGWRLDSGKILEHTVIEPNGDKIAIKEFQHGREIIKEGGQMSEAMQALTRAIEKFERHALAYERRGFVNYRLKNYTDALYDYSKSININPRHAEAYYGRAHVHLMDKELEKAIADLDMSVKTSIALQPLYWKSRRLKGNCHMELGQFDKAAFEYRLFTKRNFAPDDSNRKALKDVYFNYGRALLELGKAEEALEAIKTSKAIDNDHFSYSEAEWKEYHDKAREATA